jgi:glycosyltransferase involved in cell wall biosynthesis
MAKLKSIILFTADPWESAMPALRILRPAYHVNLPVLQGYDQSQVYTDRIAQTDLVVIERDFPRIEGFLEVIAEARRLNKPIVYETDDMLFEVPDSNIHHITYLDALLRMLQAARLADAVITSTQKLKDYLGQINSNTWLIPYYLDDSLWPLPTDRTQSVESGPVIIGYMGGHTHQSDLESIKPALNDLLKKYGNRVRLRFWGGLPPDFKGDLSLLEYIPMDILGYDKFVAFFSTQTCDIFIAPLQKDRFNQYKSHNKFLEYSSFGIPGVYSRCESYQNIVQHGKTGFLADSQSEWYQYLVQLIENPDLRHQMGRQAQASVKQNWLLSVQAADWLEVYDHILNQYQSDPLRILKNEDVLLKLLIRAQEYQDRLKDENNRLQAHLIQDQGMAESSLKRLQELEVYLQALKRTRSWQLVEFLQSLRARIFPVGGKGDVFLGNIKKAFLRLNAQK